MPAPIAKANSKGTPKILMTVEYFIKDLKEC